MLGRDTCWGNRRVRDAIGSDEICGLSIKLFEGSLNCVNDILILVLCHCWYLLAGRWAWRFWNCKSCWWNKFWLMNYCHYFMCWVIFLGMEFFFLIDLIWDVMEIFLKREICLRNFWLRGSNFLKNFGFLIRGMKKQGIV